MDRLKTPPASRGSMAAATTSETTGDSAVPTLRVMRLQSPQLHKASAGTLGPSSLLDTALCLPDSLAVYVGETFTAYLGVLNVSAASSIRNLTINAQLQTPSTRWQLASSLDNGNAAGGVEITPGTGVDAIVSHDIVEAGPHILRVEVGYAAADNAVQTFRKFYRFAVSNPLTVTERTVRAGDAACFVSVSVAYNLATTTENEKATSAVTATSNTDALVISQVEFMPSDGLTAVMVGDGKPTKVQGDRKTALELFDGCGRLHVGACFRYLFKVECATEEAKLRGIGAGDLLGKAVFTWRKAMGEMGRISSSPIHCPAAQPILQGPTASIMAGRGSNFVVHRSGLSVDVASAAATRASRPPLMDHRQSLTQLLPVTVEPIQPPDKMQLGVPTQVSFLVVNHSSQSLQLQLQFHLSQMTGLAVCGSSFCSLGKVNPNGGSTVVSLRFLALAAGLLRVQGCCVVDLATGREIAQPPLFDVFVEKDAVVVGQ